MCSPILPGSNTSRRFRGVHHGSAADGQNWSLVIGPNPAGHRINLRFFGLSTMDIQIQTQFCLQCDDGRSSGQHFINDERSTDS